jgi:S-formylglutathione hydrolase FrmB
MTQSSAQRLRECSFYSPSLGREMRYNIVLPEGYSDSAQRFPVLYLLHGWNGDHTNWSSLTNLVAYTQQYSFIVVTPDGQNSWYVNSASKPADRFYDYLTRDLISIIDAEFRTIASAEHRAIAGLSMGGYGSLLASLKRPELFCVAGSISGAFDAPLEIETVLPDVRESIEHAYGEPDSKTRKDNDLFTLVANAHPPLPYIFLQCGSADSLLPANRRFAAALRERNIAYEYHEIPGDHTWEFWDSSLPPLLRVIAGRIVP